MRQTINKAVVRMICNDIRDETIRQIEKGHIPEGWDGHEIRVLLAKKFESRIEAEFLQCRGRAANKLNRDIKKLL